MTNFIIVFVSWFYCRSSLPLHNGCFIFSVPLEKLGFFLLVSPWKSWLQTGTWLEILMHWWWNFHTAIVKLCNNVFLACFLPWNSKAVQLMLSDNTLVMNIQQLLYYHAKFQGHFGMFWLQSKINTSACTQNFRTKLSDNDLMCWLLTLNLPKFLNELIHLPFLALCIISSIIIF